jgi:DNA replication and repair protein RecF
MHVTRLSLVDFRSYASVDLELSTGVTVFVGPNGQGKTNLVEAIDYAATQGSHRVASDQPLVRSGASQAIVSTTVRRDDRQVTIELEINPGRANRARLNRGSFTRPRDALGVLRVVLFSPDDLDLVAGDPAERRRFLDDLLVARQPRFAGVRSDYDRVLRQRNSLLKTALAARSRDSSGMLATLDAWDAQLARFGADLTSARLELVDALGHPVDRAYAQVSAGVAKEAGGNLATLDYQPSWDLSSAERDRETIEQGLLDGLSQRRSDELARGLTLVGPHRDELLLRLGELPARGYASHGESWSFALALRLAAFDLLRADGDDPVLVLDDVFAELDRQRRDRLAALVADAEQVLVTAAVPDELPAGLAGQRVDVGGGTVTRA